MNTTKTSHDISAAVRELLEKYGRPTGTKAWRVMAAPSDVHYADGTLTLLPGWMLLGDGRLDSYVPLLPWRNERRFLELRRMVEDHTIGPVLMGRFCCITDGRSMDLPAILYRQCDLAEWLTGIRIVALTACLDAGRSANVILRLADGSICGIESGTTLPAGSTAIDRHELIARRGVASDRVVDTQIPQDSIYTFTAMGNKQYTDTDNELFGMSADDVAIARSACDALTYHEQTDVLRAQHRRLGGLVRLVFESDRRCRRVDVEGAC